MAKTDSRQRFLDLMMKEILKLDLAELDFGIYRILNYRRAEIEKFFDEELPGALDEAMSAEGTIRRTELEDRIDEAGSDLDKAAKELGHPSAFEDEVLRPELASSPRARQYTELQAALESLDDGQIFAEPEEDRLYNTLYTFFSRYYRDGDFQPEQRRARDARYSVPYNGEDVHFHWRSKGSHYIKTTEELKSYSFRSGGWRLRFELVEAFQEPDNVKGNNRYFIPVPDECRTEVTSDGDLFVVPFVFRPLTGAEEKRYKTKSDDLEGDSIQERIIRDRGDGIEPPKGVTKKDLGYHLLRYARKNRTDYFVHPQLGAFLRGELDYYLKNEVLDIDGLTSTESMVDRLAKLRVLRLVAGRIIDILDEIESFQARLFEKRKFVLSNSYLVPIRMVPEQLWDEVLSCDAQLDLWRDESHLETPCDRKTLRGHPSLVVDTRILGDTFQAALLESLADIAGTTDGILIRSENYGALRTFENSLRGVAAVYIDPPYNTGTDGFLYRDDFSFHSTWLSMLRERVQAGATLLREGGTLMFSCDDNEQHRARLLVDDLLGRDRFIANLVWKSRQNVDSRTEHNVSNDHEFVLVYGESVRGAAKDLSKYSNPDEDPRGPWMSDNMVGLATRSRRPNLHFKLIVGQVAVLERDREVTTSEGERFSLGRDKVVGELGQRDRVLLCVTLDSRPSADPDTSTVLAAAAIPEPRDGRIVHPGEYGCPDKGWRYEPLSLARRASESRIIWPTKVGGRPRKKTYLQELASDFTGFSSYVGFTADGTKQAQAVLGNDASFLFPKSLGLIETLVEQAVPHREMILDYFAGTGTTGHAVMSLNRADGGARRFVLVDFGDYFDDILEPRIRRVMYCPDWSGGKPIMSSTGKVEWVDLSPSLVQVVTLESYEDSLNSLEASDAGSVLGADFRLRYVVPGPANPAATALATEKLEGPFAYQLEVHSEAGVESKNVDLVTTFNLMKGIRPKRYRELDHEGRRYVIVEGTDGGETVLVVWRSVKGLDAEAERAFLETEIPALLGTALSEYVRIWHNADSALPNSESLDAEFKRLMFEPEPAPA